METIFISIAAYRDPLCPITLISIYEMAKNPERIYIGLCQQNDDKKDVDCIFPNDHPLTPIVKKNTRKIMIPHTSAKGPTYARYLCASLYKNEDYFMQIDSHSLLVESWDILCIEMLKSLDEKSILSHYPAALEDYTSDSSSMKLITTLTGTRMNRDNIPVFLGAEFKPIQEKPQLNYFISANFLFAKGKLIEEVPFDPHLPFLFEGEEILYSVRAFTNGWNVYTPNKNIIFHHYTRKGEPKFWDDLNFEARDSIIKTKILLGYKDVNVNDIKNQIIRDNIYTFGLGDKRKLNDFYKNINLKILKNNEIFYKIISLLILFLIIIICLFLIFFFK